MNTAQGSEDGQQITAGTSVTIKRLSFLLPHLRVGSATLVFGNFPSCFFFFFPYTTKISLYNN